MAFLTRSDWNDALTSTSVLQIPIEQIIFPAVTICPLGSDSHVDALTKSGTKHKVAQTFKGPRFPSFICLVELEQYNTLQTYPPRIGAQEM